MPFYEYQCQACGHEFEEFQKITDKPVKTCPECGKRKVRRLISQTSFVLKGSGWYVTDYARKGASSSSGNGGGKNGSGEKKSETKKAESKKSEPKKDKPKTSTSATAQR